MNARQLQELGDALSFLIGDFSDWPLRCAWCESERVQHGDRADVLTCLDCSRMTTCEVAADERERRARAHVDSGVGGPVVAAYERIEASPT